MYINGNDISRTSKFTTEIVDKLGTNINEIAVDRKILPLHKGNRFRCKVVSWGRSFVDVEILDHKEYASVHISKINGRFIYDISDVLNIGQIIEAKIISDTPAPRYGYEMSMVD